MNLLILRQFHYVNASLPMKHIHTIPVRIDTQIWNGRPQWCRGSELNCGLADPGSISDIVHACIPAAQGPSDGKEVKASECCFVVSSAR